MAASRVPVTGVSKAARDLAAVTDALADGPDARLARVTALIDALPDRGAADAVIAPLRGRLRQIRPPRPLRFERLLFLPLDPLIVAAVHWAAGQPAVPRPVISPIARLVRDGLGAEATEIATALEGKDLGDEPAVSRLGARLWPAAARVLRQVPTAALRDAVACADVPAEAAGVMLSGIIAVLGQASRLHALALEVRAGLPARMETLQVLLDAAAPDGVDAWSLILALLLARVADASSVLQAAEARAACWGSPELKEATARAFGLALCRLRVSGEKGGRIADGALAEATAEVERMTALVDGAAVGRKLGEVEIVSLRQRIDAQCQARFEVSLHSSLLEPLREARPEFAPTAVLQMEATARELRRFEGQARGLGGAERYDEMLAAAAERVRAIEADGSLTLADKVRMVEILAGPEAALKLLEG